MPYKPEEFFGGAFPDDMDNAAMHPLDGTHARLHDPRRVRALSIPVVTLSYCVPSITYPPDRLI